MLTLQNVKKALGRQLARKIDQLDVDHANRLFQHGHLNQDNWQTALTNWVAAREKIDAGPPHGQAAWHRC